MQWEQRRTAEASTHDTYPDEDVDEDDDLAATAFFAFADFWDQSLRPPTAP